MRRTTERRWRVLAGILGGLLCGGFAGISLVAMVVCVCIADGAQVYPQREPNHLSFDLYSALAFVLFVAPLIAAVILGIRWARLRNPRDEPKAT